MWGYDAFHWYGLRVGLSLSIFGVCDTLSLAFFRDRATKLLGKRGVVMAGIVCTCVSLVAMAFARDGWAVFVILPVLALANVGMPAFQSLASRTVDAESQGQLQGVLSATRSLALIAAPLGFAAIYGGVRAQWPGAVWLAVATVNLLALPCMQLQDGGARDKGSTSGL